jgi:glutamate N-acetyltransferase / amino-acid N-acetyltransferase
MKIKKISGSVTAPKGFLAAAAHARIKKTKKPDLALIVSPKPCRVAAVFTSNRVKAAPVVFDLRQVGRFPIHGVLTNSGNANACTGTQGLANATKMAGLASRQFDQLFGARGSKFLVCSTGRIGVQLPMEKIAAAIPEAFGDLSPRGGDRAALAMMTSDTFPKKAAVEFRIGGRRVRIGGVAKGAGMIHPRMNRRGTPLHATMLCTLTTDAVIGGGLLQKCLDAAIEQSFNSISVDGDTSTNDTVLLLANGEAGHPAIRDGSAAHRIFQEALTAVALELARMIVQDGEGMSRFVTVRIQGCRSPGDAEKIGRAIINSMLVKSAWSGGDPNWGRVMDAMGYAGAPFQESQVRIWYDGRLLVQKGRQMGSELAAVKKIVKKSSFQVTIDPGSGKHCRTFYTTDLTEKYVSFNKTE